MSLRRAMTHRINVCAIKGWSQQRELLNWLGVNYWGTSSIHRSPDLLSHLSAAFLLSPQAQWTGSPSWVIKSLKRTFCTFSTRLFLSRTKPSPLQPKQTLASTLLNATLPVPSHLRQISLCFLILASLFASYLDPNVLSCLQIINFTAVIFCDSLFRPFRPLANQVGNHTPLRGGGKVYILFQVHAPL